jgi:hypothetical protein
LLFQSQVVHVLLHSMVVFYSAFNLYVYWLTRNVLSGAYI